MHRQEERGWQDASDEMMKILVLCPKMLSGYTRLWCNTMGHICFNKAVTGYIRTIHEPALAGLDRKSAI